jgi:hypothetical protein
MAISNIVAEKNVSPALAYDCDYSRAQAVIRDFDPCLGGEGIVEPLVGLPEDEAGKIFQVKDVVKDCFIALGDGGLDLVCEFDGFGFGNGFLRALAAGEKGEEEEKCAQRVFAKGHG